MEYRTDVVLPGGCMSQVQWSSRIGHVLAAAGSAIGLGAIWKFPYVTATNGAVPSCWCSCSSASPWGRGAGGETLLGSRSQRGVLGAFHKLVGPNWRWMGYMGILCGFFIYSFCSVVGAGPWAMRPWPWAVSST